MKLSESLSEWIARRRWMSRRLRVSLIKSICPEFMQSHVFVTDFFGFIYDGNTQNLIDRKVLFSGCHECDVLAFIRDYLGQLDEPICIDIGANIGHHALFMAKYADRVIAFEPYAPVRESLQSKLQLNQISNVDVYSLALGAANEEKRFFSPPEGNLGMGSFVEDFSDANQEAGVLEVRRADDLFPELGIEKIDFIKLDVEGFEKETLTGAQQMLSHFRPVVIFESSIRLENALHSMEEIAAVFPENYRYFRFTHSGKRRHGKYLLLELTPDMMKNRNELTILAVPSEKQVPISTTSRISLQ